MRELAIQIGLIVGVVWLAAVVLFLLAPALSWWASRGRRERRRGGYLL
jgi:hypothetical protein